VVIAILAILAAILIPSVTSIIASANTATDKANARTAYLAAQVYLTTNSSTTSTSLGNSELSTYLGNAFPTGAVVSATVSSGQVTNVKYTIDSRTTYYPSTPAT
jgi:type II secretory pathway pseudopilin PulG